LGSTNDTISFVTVSVVALRWKMFDWNAVEIAAEAAPGTK
jgi:hypothetical protein